MTFINIGHKQFADNFAPNFQLLSKRPYIFKSSEESLKKANCLLVKITNLLGLFVLSRIFHPFIDSKYKIKEYKNRPKKNNFEIGFLSLNYSI